MTLAGALARQAFLPHASHAAARKSKAMNLFPIYVMAIFLIAGVAFLIKQIGRNTHQNGPPKDDMASKAMVQFSTQARAAISSGEDKAFADLRSTRDGFSASQKSIADQIIIDTWRSLFLQLPYDTDDNAVVNMTKSFQAFGIPLDAFFDSATQERSNEILVFSDLVSGKDQFPGGKNNDGGLILVKDEKLVLPMNGVRLLKDVAHRHYVGGSAGVNIRVAKGLSVHTTGGRGEAVTEQEREVVDHGSLYFTTQAIIFIGGSKTMRIPLRSVLQTVLYTDGIGVAQNNKAPLIFLVLNPSFAHDILGRLMRRGTHVTRA